MADDNRLLRVMLEEELGLTLEAYEHPLKQAFGALLRIVDQRCVLPIWILAAFPHLAFPSSPQSAIVISAQSFLQN